MHSELIDTGGMEGPSISGQRGLNLSYSGRVQQCFHVPRRSNSCARLIRSAFKGEGRSSHSLISPELYKANRSASSRSTTCMAAKGRLVMDDRNACPVAYPKMCSMAIVDGLGVFLHLHQQTPIVDRVLQILPSSKQISMRYVKGVLGSE